MGTPTSTDPAPHTLRRATAHTIATTPHHRALRPATTALPGARIRFGDDPAHTARTAAGLPPHAPLTAYAVRTELTTAHTPDGPRRLHIDRIYYTTPATGDPAPTLTLTDALALPAAPTAADLIADEPPHTGHRLRRFAAYGLVTDPTGRLLLSKIAPGYPAEGTWHLPGGGVDPGETPQNALAREIYEETGQHGTTGALIGVDHHRRAGQIGPDSPNTDIYAVWVFFHVHIAAPGEPRVTETDGSTIDCAWFTPDDLPHIPLSTTARKGLTALAAT